MKGSPVRVRASASLYQAVSRLPTSLASGLVSELVNTAAWNPCAPGWNPGSPEKSVPEYPGGMIEAFRALEAGGPNDELVERAAVRVSSS